RILVFSRLYYPHDFHVPAVTHVFPHAEVLAHRIFLGEILAGKGLIDHSDLARCGRVFVANRTSPKKARADGLKVMGSDAIEGSAVPLVRRMAFKADSEGPIVASHRAVDRVAGAGHTGDLRKALLELLVETVQFFRFVSGKRGIHPHDQAALWFETKALVFEIAKSLGQQAGPDQQNGGEGDLQYYERLPRQRRAVARRAARAAQRLGGVRV